jgi:hypothetical protein
MVARRRQNFEIGAHPGPGLNYPGHPIGHGLFGETRCGAFLKTQEGFKPINQNNQLIKKKNHLSPFDPRN